MPSQSGQQNPGQRSHDKKGSHDRMERRRQMLQRKAKRAIKSVIRSTETVLLIGGAKALRVVQKLNRPVRKRIRLDED